MEKDPLSLIHIFYDVWEHRILLESQAKMEHVSPHRILEQFISDIEIPK